MSASHELMGLSDDEKLAIWEIVAHEYKATRAAIVSDPWREREATLQGVDNIRSALATVGLRIESARSSFSVPVIEIDDEIDARIEGLARQHEVSRRNTPTAVTRLPRSKRKP
jgi:hypothetical protein